MTTDVVQHAIDYYRDRFTNHFDSYQEPYQKWMIRRPIRQELACLFGSKESVRVLDVGCGPITTLGCYLPEVDVHFDAVDILADVYNDLIDEFGFQIPVRPIQGSAKDLVRLFGRDRFDLVHCRNSLDHMEDVQSALRAMVAVTKPGGFIHIEVYDHEGRANRYEDMHQWDIYLSDEGVLTLAGGGLSVSEPLLACIEEDVALYYLINYIATPGLTDRIRERSKIGRGNFYFDSKDGQGVCTARTIAFAIRKNE